MSTPGDEVRNSLTRRSMGKNTPYNDDVNRKTEGINAVDSLEGSNPVGAEKQRLLDTTDDEEDIRFLKRDGLKPIHFGAYAIGHVYNDLCAT